MRLEARPGHRRRASGATTIRELVRNALRMRPDRIIVGEVRGPEVLDMLWAMNTGHEGSLSTCHANSPVDALRRLEVMVLSAGLDLPLAAVRDQLASALDLVVQVVRGPDGERRVHAVGEVVEPPVHDQRIRLLAGPGRRPRAPARARPARRARRLPTRRGAGERGARRCGRGRVARGDRRHARSATALPSSRRASARSARPAITQVARSCTAPARAAVGATPSCPMPSTGSAAGLRAGHAIGPGAARACRRDLPDPLGTELRPLATALEHGVPVATALDRLGR